MTESVSITQKPPRESGLELYRIIAMLLIVAHHYVVNSGLMDVMYESPLEGKALFMFLFGMWGKTGINCFVLITGYFMCTSRITLRKFLKLLLMMYIYRIVIYAIFAVTGYNEVSLSSIVKLLLPVTSVKQNFVSCYLLFYLTIPFLNILVSQMTKRQHLLAAGLGLMIYTFLGSIPKIHIDMNYVSWFIILFLIGSYLRLHPEKWFSNRKLWAASTLVSVLLAMASVVVLLAAGEWIDINYGQKLRLAYFWVADSNKVLAVAVAVSSFMLFKNLGIRYSKFINAVASAAFGVLLIHANSDTMRHWLWKDTLDNVGWYMGVTGSGSTMIIVLHAIVSVIAVYSVCTLIEYIRIRYTEKPMLDVAEHAVLRAWRKISDGRQQGD